MCGLFHIIIGRKLESCVYEKKRMEKSDRNFSV